MAFCCWRLSASQQLILQLCIGILVSIANGAQFCFGLFTPFLKDYGEFHYTQKQVSLVSTIGVVLSFFSFPAGYVYDRYGPRPTLLLASLFSFIGWMGMYVMMYRGEHPLMGTSPAVLAIVYGCAQFSASFFETGAILTSLEALSSQQGKVVLMQKTFMGLGGSIIATYYTAFFSGSSGIANFCLFLAACFLGSGLLGAWLVRLPDESTRVAGLNGIPPADDDTDCPSDAAESPAAIAAKSARQEHVQLEQVAGRRFDTTFYVGYVILFMCVTFMIGTSIVQGYVTVSQDVNFAFAAIIGVLVAMFFLMVVVAPRSSDAIGDVEAAAAVKISETASLLGGVQAEDNKAVAFRLNSRPLLENLRRPEMWYMWYVSFCVWGCVMSVSNNSAQIYKALDFNGYSETVNTVFVSIFGAASAVGRIAVGAIVPRLQARGYHVSVLFCVAPIFNVVGVPLFFVMPSAALIVPFSVIGLATGISWGSTVLIVKSLIAHRHVGMHYNFFYTAGICATIVCSVGLFAAVFDYHSEQQGHTVDHSCEGIECVSAFMGTAIALNATAVFVALKFYRRIRDNEGFVY